jgi:hypothetical protein
MTTAMRKIITDVVLGIGADTLEFIHLLWGMGLLGLYVSLEHRVVQGRVYTFNEMSS